MFIHTIYKQNTDFLLSLIDKNTAFSDQEMKTVTFFFLNHKLKSYDLGLYYTKPPVSSLCVICGPASLASLLSVFK